MNIERKKTRHAGACSFCSQGELGKGGHSLHYPYDEVTQISRKNASGAMVQICDDCLKELTDFKRYGE